MRLKDKYATTTLGGKVIAVPLGDDVVFHGTLKLNGTGAAIFEMLRKETTEEEIVEAMSRDYDAPREVLEKDVRACLTEFRKRGLLI